MALKEPDMSNCGAKRRCLSGVNRFLAYEVDQPCPPYHTFNELLCDCIPDSSDVWTITYNFSPIVDNINCVDQEGSGVCGLGAAQGPYQREYSFLGAQVAYLGQVANGHNPYDSCSNSSTMTGTVAEMTGAIKVWRSGWEDADSVSYKTADVSTVQWLGFEVAEAGTSSFNVGDLLVAQFGPSNSGAVNCPTEQFKILSAEPIPIS